MDSKTFIGVEPFDVSYGTGFQARDDEAQAIECSIVEDGGDLRIHSPASADRPSRLCFVDGVRRTEAHLTRTSPAGETTTGLAGAWGAGAVLIGGDRLATIDHIETGRAVIFTGGHQVRLCPHREGWRWDAYSVDGDDTDAAMQHLQRLMRDTEAEIADRLCSDGWLTVFDGPLHNIRRSRAVPVVGYVKTHHRRTLAPEHWNALPRLGVGDRSSLFALRDDLYACYIRVGDPGPWAGPWSGIARIEVPAGVGREAAIVTVDRAARWLPEFASAPHRDPRAPVNLTPVAGLERRLHHLLGDARLALRAVREAVMQLNREEAA